MDARIDTMRQSLVAIGADLSDRLEKTGSQIEQLTRQQTVAPMEQKVIVQHKVPRVMAELIKGQFHLMQE